MAAHIILAAIVITLAAASCQSITGFGFALVMVPLLSLAWDVKPAVALSGVLGTVTLVPLLLEVRGHIRFERLAPLLAGSLAGIPLGLLVLEAVDPGPLRILVGAVVLAATIAIYFAPAVRWRDLGGGTPLTVGVVSGVLGGSTSMNGPPVVLYLLGREPEIDAFRATLLAFFLPSSVAWLVAFGVAGRLTGQVWLLAAAGLPPMALGLWLGARLRGRVSVEVFRVVVLAVLVASSAAVIASAALG